LTANDFNITVDTGTPAVSAGITYSIVTSQVAIGTPSIASALAFNNDWNTIVVNSYGLVTSIMSALETYNGIPDPVTPTGRYAGIVLRPFVAISGSISDDPSSITDLRLNDVTIAVAPAPNSPAFAFEAAANMAYAWAIKAQNNPHLDVNADFYPDMPVPVLVSSFGTMADYTNRDAIVKKGCSTVTLENGRYKIEDFVTTYHPAGENPPQYRYVRNLNVDWNVKYGYYLLQDLNVRDKVLASDGDNISVANVVKPKTWKAVLDGYADDMASRALITQPSFMQDSITVKLGETNPDRLEVFFRYKRSGVARIVSTTAQAGFNFGAI
jgi:phage tail sheath gpL-like